MFVEIADRKRNMEQFHPKCSFPICITAYYRVNISAVKMEMKPSLLLFRILGCLNDFWYVANSIDSILMIMFRASGGVVLSAALIHIIAVLGTLSICTVYIDFHHNCGSPNHYNIQSATSLAPHNKKILILIVNDLLIIFSCIRNIFTEGESYLKKM